MRKGVAAGRVMTTPSHNSRRQFHGQGAAAARSYVKDVGTIETMVLRRQTLREYVRRSSSRLRKSVREAFYQRREMWVVLLTPLNSFRFVKDLKDQS